MNGNESQKTPGNSIKSAAEAIRGRDRTLTPEHAGEWEIANGDQTQRLLDWARENKVLRAEESLLPPSSLDGAEHRVAYDERSGLWLKTTHPGRFGMHAYVEHTLDKSTQKFSRRLEYGLALPLQYLDRLLLANEIFGDEIELTYVVETSIGLSIQTTQPDIEGTSPDATSIRDFMGAFDFQHVPAGGPSWYRKSDNILVIDAQPWNFIQTDHGDILPFDVGVQNPIGELQEYLDHLWIT